MARNPKQDANLKTPSASQARERGRKGGIASAKSKKAIKTFKEALIEGLTAEEQQIMLKALKRNAMRGNLASLEFLLKMEGQHPDQEQTADNSITIKFDGGGDYGN